MMENGWTTKPPTKEKSFMPTRISMRAPSSMEKNTGKEFTTTKLEENTKDSGSMIKSMATGSLTMLTGINTKETGGTDKEQITESTSTQTEMSTTVNGGMISNRVMESWKWPQEIDTKAIGKLERKTGKVKVYLCRFVYLCKRRHLRRLV